MSLVSPNDTMSRTSSNSFKMQKTKAEENGKYGLSLQGLTSETKKLSVDDQAALSPTSIHTTDSSAASSESQAPSFTESPPPSEKSAGKHGGSKNSSRASSAEYASPGSEISSSGEDDFVVSQAEVVSFCNKLKHGEPC